MYGLSDAYSPSEVLKIVQKDIFERLAYSVGEKPKKEKFKMLLIEEVNRIIQEHIDKDYG
jgi:hypothetical protein